MGGVCSRHRRRLTVTKLTLSPAHTLAATLPGPATVGLSLFRLFFSRTDGRRRRDHREQEENLLTKHTNQTAPTGKLRRTENSVRPSSYTTSHAHAHTPDTRHPPQRHKCLFQRSFFFCLYSDAFQWLVEICFKCDTNFPRRARHHQ